MQGLILIYESLIEIASLVGFSASIAAGLLNQCGVLISKLTHKGIMRFASLLDNGIVEISALAHLRIVIGKFSIIALVNFNIMVIALLYGSAAV